MTIVEIAVHDDQLVALDQLGRDVAIPAAHQHDRAALIERRVHAALHAGDVEERQHDELTRVLAWQPNHTLFVTSVCITLRCVSMQPFGRPVVPELYGMTHRSSGPIVSGPGVRSRASASHHSVTPGIGDRLPRRADDLGHAQCRRTVDVVAVRGDDDVLRRFAPSSGFDLRIHLLRDQRRPSRRCPARSARARR